jgi:hypothetical protein
MSKQLTIAFSKVATRLQGECKDCGGNEGYNVCVCCGLQICPAEGKDEVTYHRSPCPTCARIRTIADWEWLEGRDLCPVCGGVDRLIVGSSNLGPIPAQNANSKCISGHHKRNPTFTVQSLRAALEDLGLLDKFIVWAWNRELEYAPRLIGKLTKQLLKLAKILQTDKGMAQAVLSFLKVCDE